MASEAALALVEVEVASVADTAVGLAGAVVVVTPVLAASAEASTVEEWEEEGEECSNWHLDDVCTILVLTLHILVNFSYIV